MTVSPARQPSARAALAAASIVATVALAGCGVKATTQAFDVTTTTAPPPTSAPGLTPTTPSSPPSTDGSTTTTGPTVTGPSIPPQAEQAIVDAYVRLGLTRTQATCLAHEFTTTFGGDLSKLNDVPALTALLDKCKVSITDLGRRPGA